MTRALYRTLDPREAASMCVLDAVSGENTALNLQTVRGFAMHQISAEVSWVCAVSALLEWAPPVAEKRPVLPAPSEESVRRGLLVGAVVRWAHPEPDAEERAWRATVIAHDDIGDPLTLDIRGTVRHAFADAYVLVLPPPGDER